jgi:BMFP domain-containing protein YqiC
MTQTSNRLMDELAKLMTDAAGVAQGVRREIETAVRAQVERFLGDMDVVQREQFEAVREMAARARDDNEELRRRLAELEARVAALEGVGGSAPAGAAAKRGRRGSGGGAGG